MTKLLPVFVGTARYGSRLPVSPQKAVNEIVEAALRVNGYCFDDDAKLVARHAIQMLAQQILAFQAAMSVSQRVPAFSGDNVPRSPSAADAAAWGSVHIALNEIVEAPDPAPSAIHFDTEYRDSIRREAREGANDPDIGADGADEDPEVPNAA